MIIQKVPPIGRKVVPNDSVPDIPAITISGTKIKISASGNYSSAKINVSVDGKTFKTFDSDTRREINGKYNTLWFNFAEQLNGCMLLTLSSETKLVVSGDFRFCRSNTGNIAFIAESPFEFRNAIAYASVYEDTPPSSTYYPMISNSIFFTNTPTLFLNDDDPNVLFYLAGSTPNLKEIDFRGISAQKASVLDVSVSGRAFITNGPDTITILAPKEWETYNGGLAYENIYSKFQQIGITANFKFYEDNETYKS